MHCIHIWKITTSGTNQLKPFACQPGASNARQLFKPGLINQKETIMTYRYRVRSLEESSSKFGPCEVCEKHVSECFSQVEEEQYEYGWTWNGYLVGHHECLESKQKTN
jgi:hypothetical protein